jgi:nucleoside-diphosphate-sugar epimerase
MKVLITGAAGFLGGRLASAVLGAPEGFEGISRLTAADTTACPIDDSRLDSRTGTITDEKFVQSAIDGGVDVVYHLAAVLSGQSEAEFDFGMRVNVEGTRNLLEACRGLERPPRFVFTSTVAVFGGQLPAVVPDHQAVMPETSYGTAKAIAELLVNEYSRRGFVDGIACRVPTIAIRPGAPNSALSSFVSGIIREPLAGIDCTCPVPLDTPIWVSSPDVLTANLLHAGTLAASALEGRRTINLPGLTVTPAEMLDSLLRQAGSAARARVRCEPDPEITRVVRSWPGAFNVSRALRLGFHVDRDIDSIVRQFIEQRRS